MALVEDDGGAQGLVFSRLRPALGWVPQLLLQMSHCSREGEMKGKLDEANQVATLAAAVTIEDIFGGIDVEGGVRFLM